MISKQTQAHHTALTICGITVLTGTVSHLKTLYFLFCLFNCHLLATITTVTPTGYLPFTVKN